MIMNDQFGLLKKRAFRAVYKANQEKNRIIGSILGNTVRAYWFDQVPNFGDLLNPLLLKYYGLTPINTSRQTADVLALGSVLEKVPETYTGIIIGSGLMYDHRMNFPNAKIMALRGELTRQRIGAQKGIPLGDPGLLVPFLFPKRCNNKKYILGLVPHFIDKNDERLFRILAQYPNQVKLIDVQQKPKQVVSDIDQCEYILSSSLHGIITADSLGVPNAWILLSDKVLGRGFKFADYASALEIQLQPQYLNGKETLNDLIKFTNKNQANIPEIQSRLDSTFRIFANEFINS